MKKILAALFASTAVMAMPVHAAVETFDTAQSAAANGFQLSDNFVYHEEGSGRPYLEYYDQTHTIVAATTFTFNSISLNPEPWSGYGFGSGQTLNFSLLDSADQVLSNASVFFSDNQWTTYSNTVANVKSIFFQATGGFWPSIDNLVYNERAAEVPEPATTALLGLGLLGFAASRRKAAKINKV